MKAAAKDKIRVPQESQWGNQGISLRGDRTRQEARLPTDLEKICDEFLEQSAAFASRFVKLADLPHEKAPYVEGVIMTRCSEAIAKARVAALEL